MTGARGMLGSAMVPALAARGHEVLACDRASLDVTDAAAVSEVLGASRPDAVVQCAAYTAVDAAEDEPASAFRVNADGAGVVAAACQRIGALFVYPSTDYVFPGTATEPYRPQHDTEPVNTYGRSKLDGERAALAAGRALVVRTSWLYGSGGTNFVDTMSRLAATRPQVEVVADQRGRPTWTGTLSEAIARLVERGATGVLHVTNGGPPVTWFDFAKIVLSLQGLTARVVPVSTAALRRPARRPAYSVLDCSDAEGLLGGPLPPWPDALAEYLRSRSAG